LRDGAERVGLGPLDDDAVASLVADVLDESPSDTLLAQARGASGNPLFVIEYVRARATDGAADLSTPREFRLAVVRRLGALPESTRDVLRLASVLGTTFAPADLAVAAELPVLDVVALLQPALQASIVEDRGPRLAFRHALIRDAIYEHVPEAIRRELHRAVGRRLAAASAEAGVVAHHLGIAADAEDAEAVEWIRRAAQESMTRAPGIAVGLLEQAQSLLRAPSPVRDRVRADLAVALAWSGRLAEAEALSAEVLAGRPDPQLAGALRCGLVYALTWQGKPREARAHATPPNDEPLDARDAVLLRAEGAVASMWAFDLKTASREAAEVAEEARAIGHELALCHALTVQSLATTFARPQEAVALAREATAIADRSPTGEGHLAHPRFVPGLTLCFLDRLDEAEEMLRTGLQHAEELGLVWSFGLYHALLGVRGFIAGDWDGALAELDAALAAADEAGLHVGIIAAASAWMAVMQLHRDDLAGAQATLARALDRLAETGPQLGMGPFFWARAMVLEAQGNPGEALSLLQTSWDLFLAGGPEINAAASAPVVTDPWSAMAMVRLCVQTGDFARATALLPSIDYQSEATATPFMQGQALRCRGLVEQDPDKVVAAVALYRQGPRPFELAAVCEDAGSLLASASRVEEAVAYWEEAIGLYERLDAERDASRVRSQQRLHGVRRGSRRRHVRATSGWESVTETERRVVGLVVQGLSNPEVAERMFISRHTVESHLKSIFRKLDVSSRVELVGVSRDLA
jgi:DNA-binding CsgD family transcriptional regulator/tetratricopeptide (TPR) repeat protein